jgi:threonyl-tRNA synthetase
VLPVRDLHDAYARQVADELRERGYRVEVDEATEPLPARVRRAKLEKIPYLLVVGDDDVAAGTVGLNVRGPAPAERNVSVDDLLKRLAGDVERLGRTG